MNELANKVQVGKQARQTKAKENVGVQTELTKPSASFMMVHRDLCEPCMCGDADLVRMENARDRVGMRLR